MPPHGDSDSANQALLVKALTRTKENDMSKPIASFLALAALALPLAVTAQTADKGGILRAP